MTTENATEGNGGKTRAMNFRQIHALAGKCERQLARIREGSEALGEDHKRLVAGLETLLKAREGGTTQGKRQKAGAT